MRKLYLTFYYDGGPGETIGPCEYINVFADSCVSVALTGCESKPLQFYMHKGLITRGDMDYDCFVLYEREEE
jgi:hypothetical protein